MNIRKHIWQFYNWFINPEKARIITNKIYLNYVLLITAITFLSLIFVNFFANTILLSFISFIVFAIVIFLWIMNRFLKKPQIALFGFITLLIIVINIFYFYNNGVYGPTAFYIYPATFIITYFVNKKTRVVISIFILLNILAYTYIEIINLIKVEPYTSRYSQFFDNYTSLFISTAILIIFLADLIKIHNKEKSIAQESNRLKTAFLANTSHDIKTPINSILGFSNILDDEEISDKEIEEYVNIIQSNSNQLIRLIDDIFDVSMLKSGIFSLHPITFHLNVLLDELNQTYTYLIEKKEKKITLEFQYGLHNRNSSVFADSIRINQILSNLIQNAINHTSIGAIFVGYEKDINSDHLTFYVKDTGTGVSADIIDSIFERNITEHSESNNSGTGLGLYISKSLVELMKGEIWFESEEGKGAQFFFRIPI